MKLNKNRTGRILTVRVRIRLILPVRYPANQYRYPRSGKQKDVQNKQTKRMNREKNLYIFLNCTGDTCTTLCYDIYGTCTEYKYSRYIYKWYRYLGRTCRRLSGWSCTSGPPRSPRSCNKRENPVTSWLNILEDMIMRIV